MERKERYYTLKCPLKNCVKNNLQGRDVDKQVEISLITKASAEEDEVIRDVVKGLGALFYHTENEQEFLAELEKSLWSSVDESVENLKACIVEGK